MQMSMAVGQQALPLKIIASTAVLVSLCGVLLNGTVFWLLCCGATNPYVVYILHLVAADVIYLCCSAVGFLQVTLLTYHGVMFFIPHFLAILSPFSFEVCLCLLVAISTEWCMCVLFPIWYRCHRPKYTSNVVCTLIWGLPFCINIVKSLFLTYWKHVKACVIFLKLSWLFHGILLLVMCVSSLTLLIRLLCCSQQRKATRVYAVVQISATMFLLWALPLSVAPLITDFKMLVTTSYLISLFLIINSSTNPIIYLFVGSPRKKRLKEPLRVILQRALADKPEVGRNKKAAGIDPMEQPDSTQHVENLLPTEHRSMWKIISHI
ncbi:mas-related G-protein coupled receptor MRG [Nomascus leucogenys]|uniref:mas-related G-protein coupled receptor MRG n=1 Tax=Nomascus leucogenys TaxID=61853 RepID=UPI00122D6490|nr:mas-related G-protein coupled receptor MRG [Nomascus leucogenys]